MDQFITELQDQTIPIASSLADNFGFARDPGRNRDGVREIRLGLLEISGDFLKSVEWAAFHPSYNRARKRAQNVPKEKR